MQRLWMSLARFISPKKTMTTSILAKAPLTLTYKAALVFSEQASSRGHVQESANGLLTFPFTIRNQVATSFSTLRAATALRKELLMHQRDFFTSALSEAEKSAVKAYVFGSERDAAKNVSLRRYAAPTSN